MSENLYGFKGKPFQHEPNPRFLYLSKKHKNALAYLEYGLSKGSGFILLAGDIGAGKTSIVKHALNSVKDTIDITVIFDVNADFCGLIDLILHEFNIESTYGDKTKSIDAIFQYLIKKHSQGKSVLLVIDEAQNLSNQEFEEIQMLYDLQTDNHRLLQIMLVGQPKLKRRLQSTALTQISQRTVVYYHLGALEPDEIKGYIVFCLEKAGGPLDIFTENTFDLIYQASGGIPRSINLLCDAALVYGAAESLERINVEVISRVIRDKEGLGLLVNKKAAGEKATEKEEGEYNRSLQRLRLEGKVATLQRQNDKRLTDKAEYAIEANDRLVAELTESLRNERGKNDKLLLEYGRLKSGLVVQVNNGKMDDRGQAISKGLAEVTFFPLLSQATASGKGASGQEPKIVFVKEDNSAKIHCESCGKVEMVSVQHFAFPGPAVRIRCACAAVFPVRFEYRKFYRKGTNLEGSYHVIFDEIDIPDLSLTKKTINCRIENISMHGVGFSTMGRNRIAKNARLILGFFLDNLKRTWVEKIGMVQIVQGSYVGLQFEEPARTPRELGFYLRP